MKKKIPPYNVINWDFNSDNIEFYDIMPYLVTCWKEDKKRTHKLWAMSVNSKADSADIRVGRSMKMSAHAAIAANVSKVPRIDDTKMPESFDEFKTFIERCSLQEYWSRCQYEVIVTGWPVHKNDYKLDVYEQIMSNIDVITRHFMDYVNGGK